MIWTDPYRFFTTGKVGVTAAIAFEDPDGREWVAALGHTIETGSSITQSLTPTEHGVVAVFSEEGVLFGWPRGASPGTTGDELHKVDAAGVPALTHAEGLRFKAQHGALRFVQDGKAFWTGSVRTQSDYDSVMWTVTVVPESDLVGFGDIRRGEAVTLALVALGLAIAVGWILVRAVRRRLDAEARDARQLGRYHLEEKLGEGGMGTVYRAEHDMLHRPTAVKVLTARHARGRAKKQFEREVQTTSTLTHPNTVEIYDYGYVDDGTFYYAMEFIEGVTLRELVEFGGPLPPDRAVHLLVQICGSLVEAHAAGLIHRDIKPDNIMVCTRGGMHDVVKVLDFGLVNEVGAGTGNGELSGTPAYMAPESIRDSALANGATDVYGMGGVACFLLTGAPPFSGDNWIELCTKHLRTEPTPLSQRVEEIPRVLEVLALQCLEKSSRDRLSASEFLRELIATGIADSWSEDRAADWWERHGDKLARAVTAPVPCAEGEVMTVRLGAGSGVGSDPLKTH